jgi:hypothetical protein
MICIYKEEQNLSLSYAITVLSLLMALRSDRKFCSAVEMGRYQLKLFYSLQCGFYIYSVVALVVWETRRKDFSVMMSHHIITIGLIGYSYITG